MVVRISAGVLPLPLAPLRQAQGRSWSVRMTAGEGLAGARLKSYGKPFRRGEFSRRLEVFPPGQFGKDAAHRFLSQAGISVHNLGNGHACGERLKNKRDGDACAAHSRAASKVLWVTDNPVVHSIKLTLAE